MTVNQNFNGNVGQVAGRDINNYSDGRQFSEQSDIDLAAMYNRAGQEIRQSGARKNNYGVKLLLPTLAILGLCLLAYELFDLSQSLLSFVVVLGSVYVIGKALRHHQREDERIGELNAIRKSIYQENTFSQSIISSRKTKFYLKRDLEGWFQAWRSVKERVLYGDLNMIRGLPQGKPCFGLQKISGNWCINLLIQSITAL